MEPRERLLVQTRFEKALTTLLLCSAAAESADVKRLAAEGGSERGIVELGIVREHRDGGRGIDPDLSECPVGPRGDDPAPSLAEASEGFRGARLSGKRLPRSNLLSTRRLSPFSPTRLCDPSLGYTDQQMSQSTRSQQDAIREALEKQGETETHDRSLIVERLSWTPEQRLEANAAFLRFYLSVRPEGPLIREE